MRTRLLAACALAVGCASRAELPEAGPDFQPPRLLNTEQVTEFLRARAGEREARIVLWLYVDTAGFPLQIRIRRGTGDAALDSAAVRVARIMEFEPARRAGRRTFAWVEQALVFVPAPKLPREIRGRAAPRLLNDVSIVGRIRSEYRGLSGWARVWVLVSRSGRPEDVRVLSASSPRLRRPAEEVALGLRFGPARLLRAGGLAGEATPASTVYRVEFGPEGTVRAEIVDLDQASVAALQATAPYDDPPRPRDPAGARATLEEAIRRVGAPSTTRALLWLFIDARGDVELTHLRTPSGDERVDDVLVGAVRRLEFVPARRAGEPVGAWYEMPVGGP
jgi:TonB family protein